MVRDHYPRLAAESGDAQMRADVAAVAPRVFELSEFLVDQLGVEDLGAYFPHRVTNHPSCHSLRLVGVGDAPQRSCLLHIGGGLSRSRTGVKTRHLAEILASREAA